MKVKKRFFKKIFFNSRSDFAKSRSAIRICSVSSKPSRLSTVMPSQLKMNLVCIAKAAKIKMKKIGSEKRRIHFILHVVVISGTDLGSLIAVISSTLQKLQQNRPARVLTFRSNYDYTVPVNCFKI